VNLLAFFKNAQDAENYNSGDIIIDENNPGDVMYVVLEGEADIMVREKKIDTVGPGDIVGEMALIDGITRSATVVAKTACRLAPVNEKRFLFMVQETPFFSLHVMRVLVDRLRRMDSSI
jgi:CRP-like cAMP-binding protein